MKAIRFAPLIRVSTETQQKQGESLQTQKKQIAQYVKTLNGIIPDNCWKYSGQEHATPGHERKKLAELLADSDKGIFDAIIVCDASRWSRDNEKSKQGLKVFKKNGIKFFVGSSEYDLYDPQASLFLGLSGEMNEFFALEQSRKSMLNKIERAKRGIPTCGNLPFGRIYDKQKNAWAIDKEKQNNIKWAAERYLKGESLRKIAKTLNMNMSNLWKTLKNRAGDEWTIHFKSPRLNIKETVKIKIPRILPQDTIEQIHEKAQANKTYTHGHIKHKYLLARTVFCNDCSYSMYGETNKNKYRYYRHARYRKIECDTSFLVKADELEDAVMLRLFQMFGDVESVEKAMIRAIPDNSKIEKLREQKQIFGKQLEKADRERQRLVKSIAKGIISSTDAEQAIKEIRERETLLKDEIEKIKPQVQNVPTAIQVKRRAKLIKRTLEAIYTRPGRLKKMSFDEKRKIVQTAFGGKDAEGNRLGVYVTKPETAGGPVSFEIKGVFGDVSGHFPMTEKEIKLFDLGLNSKEQDILGNDRSLYQEIKYNNTRCLKGFRIAPATLIVKCQSLPFFFIEFSHLKPGSI